MRRSLLQSVNRRGGLGRPDLADIHQRQPCLLGRRILRLAPKDISKENIHQLLTTYEIRG